MSSFLFSSYLLHFNCKFVKQKAPPPGERFLCYLVDPFHQAMDPLDEEEEDEPKDNRD